VRFYLGFYPNLGFLFEFLEAYKHFFMVQKNCYVFTDFLTKRDDETTLTITQEGNLIGLNRISSFKDGLSFC